MPTDPELRKMAEIMKRSRSQMLSSDSDKLYAQACHSMRGTTTAPSSGGSFAGSAKRPGK